jgi:hypothetical protein
MFLMDPPNCHMRTPFGDRFYACTTCGQACSDSSNLTRHTRTHSGGRPYACTTCGMAFSESGNVPLRTVDLFFVSAIAYVFELLDYPFGWFLA